MSINYTYTIVSVDEQARCMEIIYAAEGHPTQHISARLPFVGETTESVVRMYAPVSLWLELSMPMVTPEVGQAGTINAADEAAAAQAAAAADEAATQA